MVDKLFRTPDGTFVAYQRPNAPAILAIVAAVLAIVLRHTQAAGLLRVLACLLLAVWSFLELDSGVNLFRRLCGAAGLIVAIVVALA